MSLAFIPCEVFHREFDSKLLLSLKLVSNHNQAVIFGNDKHLNYLLSLSIPPSVLFEKSCSTLMWETRISNIIKSGGSVIVNDEEGFNNLETLSSLYLSRVDANALNSISTYYSWGDVDQKFFSVLPGFDDISCIGGNTRSDLLDSFGRQFYSSESSSITNLFGDFVLCSDNFAVEHRQGSGYKIPRFNVDDHQHQLNVKTFTDSVTHASNRRDFFAQILKSLLIRFPDKQFVLRPHPVSDPRWWLNEFWQFRNFHLVYHLNIEPWIHACTSILSFGCTSSMQALMAHKPVIEISPVVNTEFTSLYGDARGFSHLFTPYIAHDSKQAISALGDIYSGSPFSLKEDHSLNDFWFTDDLLSRSSFFAEKLSSLSSPLTRNSYSQFQDTLNYFCSLKLSSKLPVNSDKWINPSFNRIQSSLAGLSSLLNISPPHLKRLTNTLYILYR